MSIPKTNLARREFLEEFKDSGRFWPVDSPLEKLWRLAQELLKENEALRFAQQQAEDRDDD